MFIVRDTLLVGLKQANAKASLLPSKRNKVPQINAELQVDSLRLRAMGNRLNLPRQRYKSRLSGVNVIRRSGFRQDTSILPV